MAVFCQHFALLLVNLFSVITYRQVKCSDSANGEFSTFQLHQFVFFNSLFSLRIKVSLSLKLVKLLSKSCESA